MADATHTPTPWGFGRTSGEQRLILGDEGRGRYVCHVQIHQTPRRMVDEPEREANAALIVKAVNAHEDLVAALLVALVALDLDPENRPPQWSREDAAEKIRAAILRAEGASP